MSEGMGEGDERRGMSEGDERARQSKPRGDSRYTHRAADQQPLECGRLRRRFAYPGRMGPGFRERRVSDGSARRFVAMTGKRVLHGGLLAFTAFWLVATSRPQETVKECFVPLHGRALAVTLGAPLPPEPGAGPSCREIDGLKEGSVLRVTLTRSGTPPQVGGGNEVCWSYDPKALSGPVGTSAVQGEEPSRQDPTTLFEARGPFARPGPECAGTFLMNLMTAGPFRAGMRADPFRAGPREPWRLRRLVSVTPGGPCSFTFRESHCVDTFEVKTIAPAR
jgi:hypothetical protein